MSSLWRIRRSAVDRKLVGVCGGVAAHWGVDPVLVRVGWALLALTGGVGVVLYVAGWLLIPLEGSERSTADDLVGGPARRWPKEVWITLVVIACVATFALFGSVSPFGIGPALVVAVVWYFGFYRNRGRRARSSPVPPPPAVAPPVTYPGPPTPFTEAATAWQTRVQQVRQQPAPAPAPVATYAPYVPPPVTAPVDEHAAYLAEPDPVGLYTEPEPPAPVRPGTTVSARRLRLLTLVVLGLTLAALGLASYAGVHVGFPVYAAAALLVVGLALVAATWCGRARGLLPLGVLLALTTLVGFTGISSAVAEPVRNPGQWGERQLSYGGDVALPTVPDRLDGGELTVDLSQLRLISDAAYDARVDYGRLEVVIPPGTGVRLTYAVGWGQVEAFDRQIDLGRNLSSITDLVPAADGAPTLTLDLAVGHGQVEVRR